MLVAGSVDGRAGRAFLGSLGGGAVSRIFSDVWRVTVSKDDGIERRAKTPRFI